MTIAEHPKKQMSARMVTAPAAGIVAAVSSFCLLALTKGEPVEPDLVQTVDAVESMPEPPPWAENVPQADPALDDGCQVSVQATHLGRPVNDVTLTLHRVGAAATESTWSAVPHDDGVHRFADVPPGTYHVVAWREATAPQAALPWTCAGPGQRAFFELDLPAGGADLEGRVTGKGDEHVVGTELLIEQPHGHRGAFPGVVHVPLDEQGGFTVRLLPGRYTLLALAPHHVARTQEVTVDEHGGVTRIKLDWRPEVSGRVYDASGAPVAGAEVFLGPSFDPRVPPSVVKSGADGSFVLPALPGRDLVVTARTDDGFGVAQRPAVTALEGYSDVAIQLARGRAVTGWIEHRDGRPCGLCDVSFRVKAYGLVGSVKANDDGTVFLGGMPLDADVELWPKDGAIGAWGGQVATPTQGKVLLTYVPPAY